MVPSGTALFHLVPTLCLALCSLPFISPHNHTEPTVYAHVQEEVHFYLTQIFNKYGSEGKMTFEGFEHLLEHLGLAKLRIQDHGVKDHYDSQGKFVLLHINHEHNDTLEWDTTAESSHSHSRGHHSNHDNDNSHQDNEDNGSELQDVESHGDSHVGKAEGRKMRRSAEEITSNIHKHEHNKCMSAEEMLASYHLSPTAEADVLIDSQSFLQLCPAIIFQLDTDLCLAPEQNKCVSSADNGTSTEASGANVWNVPLKVWGYSLAAVSLISLVGLASVALIPLMTKLFYQHLIQFLVALAVGTLTGDALLHLMPHAISHPEAPDIHHDPCEVPKVTESGDEGHGHNEDAIWKGLLVLGGMYAFFMMERLMAIVNELRRRRKQRRATEKERQELGYRKVGKRLSSNDDDSCDATVHSTKEMNEYAVNGHTTEEAIPLREVSLRNHHDPEGHQCDHEGHDQDSEAHHHGHSHEVPTSISAIAWMVIMGDGLHNFVDGMAIGAAFGEDIAVGLSTTIAVFCHELPHELGDFAVLLRAGMRVRQALMYNIASSILCLMGMVGGLLLGNIGAANTWIFALTAGIFIYISLVDMLPEITVMKPHEGEYMCCHLLLQMLGISTGVVIMLLIAMFEDKIQITFGS